jgi:transcriptional regulator with XRE-family HTH domain
MTFKREKRVIKPVKIEDMSLRRRPKTEATDGNNIRNWRLFRGVETHEQLTEMTIAVDEKAKGVNRVTIARLENGVMRYNQDQVELIAAALGTTPRDLIATNPFNSGDLFVIYAQASLPDRQQIDAFARALARSRKDK